MGKGEPATSAREMVMSSYCTCKGPGSGDPAVRTPVPLQGDVFV